MISVPILLLAKKYTDTGLGRIKARDTAVFNRYLRRPLVVLGDFETAETWSRLGGSAGDVAADTVNFKSGTQGLMIRSTGGATTYAQRIPAAPLNLTGIAYLSLWVYTATPGPGVFDSMRLYLYGSDPNNWNTITRLVSLAQSQWSQDGWFRCRVSWSDLTQSGTPNIAAIDKIVFEVKAVAGTTASITVDRLVAVPAATTRGKVTLRFDDGLASQFLLGRPILDKLSYRGVVAVTPFHIGTTNYMTLAQLKTLRDAGWDIVNHTWDHTALTHATADQARTAILRGANWLVSNGFDGGRFLALPGHLTNPTVQAVCRELTVLTASGPLFYETLPPWDPMALRWLAGDNIVIATLKAYIDKCEANKDWITILFHTVDSAGGAGKVTPAVLTELVEYIATKAVDVVTWADVVDGNPVAIT